MFGLTSSVVVFIFFFNDTATTEIYTLSLHDALPISSVAGAVHACAHDVGPARNRRSSARRSRRARKVREAAMSFGAVEQAIRDIRAGKLVIVADDEARENEGDLVGAAEMVTADMINFMATHARGLICMPLTPD